MPAVVGRMRVVVEVEQHSAVILVHEDGLSRTGRGCHLNLAGLGAFRNHNGYLGTVTGGCIHRIDTGELDLDGIEEIGTADGYGLSRVRPLEGHRRDLRCGRKDLEIIGDFLAILGDHIYLVSLDGRHGLGNRNEQGLGCHVAGVQDGSLVVEIEVVDAGEIVTYDAYNLFHVGLGDDDVLVGIADEIHLGDS